MEEIKVIATIIGAVVGLLDFAKGLIEYQLQGTQRRADIFLKRRAEYFENESFATIRVLLEEDGSQKLRDISFEERRAYLTFFEEVALLWKSKLIRDDIAYYMFGYYAVRCREAKDFWFDINAPEVHWSIFLEFANTMKRQSQSTGFPNIAKMRF